MTGRLADDVYLSIDPVKEGTSWVAPRPGPLDCGADNTKGEEVWENWKTN